MKTAALFLGILLILTGMPAAGDWRHFRGTDCRSVAHEQGLPTRFGPEENVAWNVLLPGPGPSGPIVVAGRVIVTAASGPRQDRLHILALDAATGKTRWDRRLWATGSTICNPFGGVAASTPASDGQRVFALFSSNDLACFDLDGNLKWLRGLGYESPSTRSDVGMASSPLAVGDTVIVQLESTGPSLVFGIDAATGATRWRLERPQGPAWTSPTLLPGSTHADDLVLIQSRGGLTAVEPRTGREVWQYEAACSTLSSVAADARRIFLPAAGLTALGRDGGAAVAPLWNQRRLNCENASPIVAGDRLYLIKSPSILTCAAVADGRTLWQLRLKGPIWATPVVAGDLLFAVNYDGLVQVVRLGKEGELAGSGQLDGKILASPAVAEGAIYFRTSERLWKIAAKP